MRWHSLQVRDVFTQLESDSSGLGREQAGERLKRYGPNEIRIERGISPFKIFLSQFSNFLVIVLIAAALISIGVSMLPGRESHYVEAGLILAIVFANGVFGFTQEFKAEKSLEALKRLSPSHAIVFRQGQRFSINATELVPGDVIFLSSGEKVPADARLFEASNLHLDESLLTGESVPVSKRTKALPDTTNLAERINLVFKNTVVTSGTGKAVVTATGLRTEVGKIAARLHTGKQKVTPFHLEMEQLGKRLGLLVFIVIALVALTQIFLHEASLLVIFIAAVSLAVAAIPEGLPAVVTLSLALGTRKMVRKKALVRKLSSVEGLGSVDTICTDKTATLTENRMSVTRLFCNGKTVEVTGGGDQLEGSFFLGKVEIQPREFDLLMRCGALCNDAAISTNEKGEAVFVGDPTEIALLVSARKAGLNERRLNSELPRVEEMPFASEKKRMLTVHRKGSKEALVFMKGAPETVLLHCSKILVAGKVQRLTEKARQEVLQKNKVFASDALRVLGFAFKRVSGKCSKKDLEKHLVFLGLQGMIDPPRKEVKQSIAVCKEAGIRVIMVTGDNALTAKAIASQLGLGSKVLLGENVHAMTEQQLRKEVEHTDIFARVSPNHKLRILKALQANNHVVAMTGDGVNDAPALHSADVGVSMGLRGTDVAREASDIILLDDNFKTIQEAVAEGRTIFSNIRKFVLYLLLCNVAEVLVIFFASLMRFIALTAPQILWINLLTDGMPALALGVDPQPKDIMGRKPKKKSERVINGRVIALIAVIGMIDTIFLLAIFFWAIPQGLALAQSMLFTGIILSELVRIAVIRQQEKLGLFSNKWLIAAVIASLALQLALIYSPLSVLFGVVGLGLSEWLALLFFIALSAVAAIGVTKLIVRLVPAS